ncbi:MAG: aspartyl protease family protein [bacterium]
MSGKFRTHTRIGLVWVALTMILPFSPIQHVQAAEQSTGPYTLFAQGDRALDIPFELVDDMIIIRVTIDDSVDVKLVYDTGFGNSGAILYDPEMGRQLGLNYSGKVNLGGGGTEGGKFANIATNTKLSLPGVTFAQEVLLVLDKPDSFMMNLVFEGIIGGSLTRSVVVLDYDKSVLHLYDPASYTPDSEMIIFPVTFSYGIPVIDAEIEVEQGNTLAVKLLFDTGVPGMPLMLFTFSDKRLQRPNTTVELRGQGMGGEMMVQFGRIASMRLGPWALHHPVTAFVDSEAYGAATVLGQDGMLGHDTMQRFKVALDYAGGRIGLRPNMGFDRIYELNMTGMVAAPLRDGTLRVDYVMPTSPAANQDIQKGDLVLKIDGKDIRAISWEDLRRITTQAGENITLTIVRDSQSFNRTLLLRRLI